MPLQITARVDRGVAHLALAGEIDLANRDEVVGAIRTALIDTTTATSQRNEVRRRRTAGR